jgi:streptogramin lyase
MVNKRPRLLVILGSCTILLFVLLGCTPTPPDNFVSTGGPIGYNIYGITSGPDGNLWFTELNDNQIAKISPASGSITEYNLPGDFVGPYELATGPDGNVWFTESNQNKIGKISPTGEITEYSIPTTNVGPYAIAAGPDGNLWFTETYKNQIGKISPASGNITEYTLSIPGTTTSVTGPTSTTSSGITTLTTTVTLPVTTTITVTTTY